MNISEHLNRIFCVTTPIKCLGVGMRNITSSFVPTDKDIRLVKSGISSESNEGNNNVFVYLAKIEDVLLYSGSVDANNIDLKENKVSCQRRAGFSLLKYAVKDRWGIDEDLNNIKVSENGKPYTDGYQFSISHCNNLLCVAISMYEVGVDIECTTTQRNWKGLSRRVLTQKEKGNTSLDSQTMTELWTKKEAVFKLRGDKVFSPSHIDYKQYFIDTVQCVSLEEKDYILTLATKERTNNCLVLKKAIFNNNHWELI